MSDAHARERRGDRDRSRSPHGGRGTDGDTRRIVRDAPSSSGANPPSGPTTTSHSTALGSATLGHRAPVPVAPTSTPGMPSATGPTRPARPTCGNPRPVALHRRLADDPAEALHRLRARVHRPSARRRGGSTSGTIAVDAELHELVRDLDPVIGFGGRERHGEAGPQLGLDVELTGPFDPDAARSRLDDPARGTSVPLRRRRRPVRRPRADGRVGGDDHRRRRSTGRSPRRSDRPALRRVAFVDHDKARAAGAGRPRDGASPIAEGRRGASRRTRLPVDRRSRREARRTARAARPAPRSAAAGPRPMISTSRSPRPRPCSTGTPRPEPHDVAGLGSGLDGDASRRRRASRTRTSCRARLGSSRCRRRCTRSTP